jgi:hypothetical protein
VLGLKPRLLESHGFTVDVYLDYASELANRYADLQQRRKLYFCETCQSIKSAEYLSMRVKIVSNQVI